MSPEARFQSTNTTWRKSTRFTNQALVTEAPYIVIAPDTKTFTWLNMGGV